MPEGHRKRPGRPLSDAHATGELVRIRCGLCRTTSHYLPEDLISLFGDVTTDVVENKMRCKCGSGDWMTMKLVHLTAAERMTIRIRRIAKVWTVRKVRWREE